VGCVKPLSSSEDSGFYERSSVSRGLNNKNSSSADPSTCLPPRIEPAVSWRHSVVPVSDLTDKVKTSSKSAIAHGGFSDIYLGKLECENVVVGDGGGSTRVGTRQVRF
jgi:hypothetical protein